MVRLVSVLTMINVEHHWAWATVELILPIVTLSCEKWDERSAKECIPVQKITLCSKLPAETCAVCHFLRKKSQELIFLIALYCSPWNAYSVHTVAVTVNEKNRVSLNAAGCLYFPVNSCEQFVTSTTLLSPGHAFSFVLHNHAVSITLCAKLSGTVYCNRSYLCVCLWVTTCLLPW